jgi:HPr kinase/phosphorylase
VEVPLARMPVAPGRNIALLVEVAARNQLLREGGFDPARRFVERVDELVGSPPRLPRPRRRGARKHR